MKPLLFTILTGVVVTILAFFNDGFFGGLSVCTQCGRMKHESRTYWIPSAWIEETSLGRFHSELAGGQSHEHSWLFAWGGGGQITCAIGQGRHLYSAIHREETKQALELIRKHRGDDAAKLWLGRLLDPESSQNAVFALAMLSSDEDGFDASYQEVEEDFAKSSSRNP